jgi:hypothetical protein
MKQYLTILRVLDGRGETLAEELRSCPNIDLAALREQWKGGVGQPEQLTYMEYFDAWTGGDVFEDLSIPSGLFEKIETEWGSLHFSVAGPGLSHWLKRMAGRKTFQFEETARLYRRLHACLTEFDAIDKTGALLLFRQPIGGSLDDHEIRESLGK